MAERAVCVPTEETEWKTSIVEALMDVGFNFQCLILASGIGFILLLRERPTEEDSMKLFRPGADELTPQEIHSDAIP